jgi:hypothetical protein
MGVFRALFHCRSVINMTHAPHFYRTCNLTASSKSAIFCGLQRIFMVYAPSRVKRCATAQTHGNSPLSIERLPERGVNMGYIGPDLTATLPQGELK